MYNILIFRQEIHIYLEIHVAYKINDVRYMLRIKEVTRFMSGCKFDGMREYLCM